MTDLVRRLRQAPAVGHPPTFADAEVSYLVHDTPIGRMLLACRASGALVASVFAPSVQAEDRVLDRLAATVSPRVLRLPASVDPIRRRLDDYLAGRIHGLGVEVDWALASPWQHSVLATLSERVPYGARASYGQLAAWVGRPRGARAVGAALGANPLCVVVPCHRVVGARGALTGYAGGLAAKERLLELEAPRA